MTGLNKLELFHATRMVLWIALGAYVLAFNFSLAKSIPLIFIMSCYANIESAASTWQGRRAQREAREAGESEES